MHSTAGGNCAVAVTTTKDNGDNEPTNCETNSHSYTRNKMGKIKVALVVRLHILSLRTSRCSDNLIKPNPITTCSEKQHRTRKNRNIVLVHAAFSNQPRMNIQKKEATRAHTLSHTHREILWSEPNNAHDLFAVDFGMLGEEGGRGRKKGWLLPLT